MALPGQPSTGHSTSISDLSKDTWLIWGYNGGGMVPLGAPFQHCVVPGYVLQEILLQGPPRAWDSGLFGAVGPLFVSMDTSL